MFTIVMRDVPLILFLMNFTWVVTLQQSSEQTRTKSEKLREFFFIRVIYLAETKVINICSYVSR